MLSRVVKLVALMAVFIVAAAASTYLTIHTLIRSKDTVVVPDLQGKEIVYALEVLTDLNLNTKVKGSDYSTVIAKNHVISQDPSPGSEIKKGRDVRLVISKGARAVVVPNMAAMPLPQARIVLEENGLRQGVDSRLYHPVTPRGDIITQYPPPGRTVLRGSSVDLLVSRGPSEELFAMVDLKSMPLDQAVIYLEQYHLTVGAIKYIDSERLSHETVTAQTPESGYPVAPGTDVAITVNRPAGQTGTRAKHESVLYRYRVPQGFLRRAVRIRVNRPHASHDIFNDFVKPGSQIWLLIPDAHNATVLLYVDDELIRTTHSDDIYEQYRTGVTQ